MVNISGLSRLEAAALPLGVRQVLNALRTAGGRPLLVGGIVRDAILGLEAKDFDVEVFGLDKSQVEEALQHVGTLNLVGKSFGVIKVSPFAGDTEVDVSLPRLDNKTGRGIKGFVADFPPTITPRQAAQRRDFTINAFAFDPFSNELFDFFGGLDDLNDGILRHVSPAFAEDPERVRRGMQFAARFGMQVAPETAALCRTLLTEADTSPKERIWAEWQKWALRGEYPSKGLAFLQQVGWLETVPELAALVGCPQDPIWHPEGDVFMHTQHVCDAAAQFASQHNLTRIQREVLMFSALCHDLGKPITVDVGTDGRIRNPDHAIAGVALTEQFLTRIGAPAKLIVIVCRLTQYHMDYIFYSANWQRHPSATVLQLADRLHPATLRQWEALVTADTSGRPPLPKARPAQEWLRQAEMLNCADQRQPDLISGRDLISWGVPAGALFGKVLAKIRAAQFKGQFYDRESAMAWILAHCPEIQLVKGRDLVAIGYPADSQLGDILKATFARQLRGEFKNQTQALDSIISH